MRQLKLFIGRLSDKVSRHNSLGQETMQAGNWAANWPLYIEVAPTYHGPPGKRQVQETGQEKESSYHIFCQYPTLAGHTLVIISSAWLELTDISTASIMFILALVVQSGLFEGP
jgi:hypothetical protein